MVFGPVIEGTKVYVSRKSLRCDPGWFCHRAVLTLLLLKAWSTLIISASPAKRRKTRVKEGISTWAWTHSTWVEK